MKSFVGIDCGLDGYVVVIDDAGVGRASWPTPTLNVRKDSTRREYDVAAMREILEEIRHESEPFVVLEKQQAMPGLGHERCSVCHRPLHQQGVSSSFTTGRGFGLWEGLLCGLRLSYAVVHPKTWQAACLRDIPGDNTKARAIIAAQRLFPGVDLRKTPACKGAHDGKADALLMSWYGWSCGNLREIAEAKV